MIQFVGDDGIPFTEQRFEQIAVGIKARAVEDRVLGAQKLAQFTFQRLVGRLGAANEADGGKSVAPFIEPRVGGRPDGGMLGQAEVIVGAQVDDRRAIPHPHMRALGRLNAAFRFISAGRADGGELDGEVRLQGAKHDDRGVIWG